MAVTNYLSKGFRKRFTKSQDNVDTKWASDYYTDEEIKAMNDALFESGEE